MEENIKDIELFIDFCRAPYNFEHESEEKSYKELSDKIEHLIKAYKELEYKYNKSLSDLVQAEHKNKEIEEENQQIETIKDEAIRRYNFESIPVSLVEEKIEELEGMLTHELTRNDGFSEYREYALNVLQELLEKRK